MDIPQPPRDTSLRNIIDKLAEFVARNGPEFEQITKAKQKGNPKFEFLYGGEFYNYYQYRVASEQNFLKQQASISQAQVQQQVQQQQQQQQHISQSMQNVQQQAPVGYSNSNMQPGLWTNGSNGSSSSTNMTSQIEAINMQQNSLRDQIRQSEQNLSAQHGVLVQQQQKQIEEAITKAQNDSLQMQAEENNIRLAEFDAILQPIIESCTKDSISTGKNWILQHTSDTSKCNVVLQYLLKKALVNGSTFSQKLHLIYLVNDVLHHCVRKNANDLKACLENVVIPMFCSAEIIANDEQKAKLTKLLSLWESKAKFFDACVISKLRCPESSMQEYKTNLMNVHNNIVTQVTQATKAALESYQQQHQVFIQHATQQIATLETQKQALEQQVLAKVLPNAALIPPLMEQQIQIGQLPPQVTQRQPNNLNSSHGLHGNTNSGNNNLPIPNLQIPNNNQMMSPQPHPPPLMAQKITMPVTTSFNTTMNSSIGSSQLTPEPPILHQSPQHQQPQQQQPQQQPQPQQQQQQQLPPQDLQTHSHNLPQSASYSEITSPFQQQPPQQIPATLQYPQSIITSSSVSNSMGRGGEYTSPPPNFQIPDLSKPPPGFSQSSQSGGEEEVRPSIPYYELPAGLMVPLIRLEDYNYKPLNPEDVRLPPPAPSNERLSSAIIAFYSLPSHNRPRDVDGWEKLGLYEYYKVKNAARKQKEEEIASGKREKSRSPSPIYIEPVKPKKPNKRRYRSKSRSRSKSKSRSPRRSRTRSRTPERRNIRYTASRRSRSPKRSPVRERERDRDRDRERERDRERAGRERERERERSDSPPPSFFGGNYTKSNEFIEESNKGHQMLMKMGWGGSGTGLGLKGQGIDSPVAGGEVRDKKDLYKGVGINMNDPFENFRKNKGAAFIHRMRSRAEEKS